MQPPRSPYAPASAGSDGPGSARDSDPGQSNGKKRTAKESAAEDEYPGRGSGQKRRRRAFSCLSCQRLKCRCEYDPGAQGCHRCQTLRIPCSLRGQHDVVPNLDSAEPARPRIEESLQRHEDALTEIKTMIRALKSESQTSNRSQAHANSDSGEDGAPAASNNPPDPEYLSNPVDSGSKSAPIVVLREMTQVTLGQRRASGHGSPDLVQLRILDEQTASELMELFLKYQSHMILVRNHEDVRPSGAARRVSAFLHSVCCLMGVVYRDDISGTPLYNRMSEQVQMILGQALLSSPLDLDDLNALFIMSNNANVPSQRGVEYIDSWLLTGYCAKQAMLSIYFTQIVNRLKKGNSTLDDHRSMHLWSAICLHHLHWAATTGRPSIIPKGSHINQCNVLLSFYQATMQDGMLVAEIMLYSTLHEKIFQEPYSNDGRECEEFRAWKQRWNHLLALPTSSMLRIGYHAACLILAVHGLNKTEDALGSTSLFSTDAASTVGSASVTSKPTPYADEHRDTHSETTRDGGDADSRTDHLRVNVCKYAKLVVETFVESPPFLMDAAPMCTRLCLGYCALVLAHYDASQSLIPSDVVLGLITRLDRWIRTSPGNAWLQRYGKLAIRKVEARINAAAATSTPATPPLPGATPDLNAEYQPDGAPRATTPRPPDVQAYNMLPTATTGPDDGLPSFNLGEQGMLLPSMEGFFGGGFLDFMG
ncbi:hypothetical protein F4861DRAFT_493681 [Xylaria intraflava]|nr:hypothetical protein F4861DRAFT_493681 [Xylaria intraflava]